MTHYLSTEGFIIRAQDYKEFDQLLSVYTLEKGKLRLLVKGVKKTSSKLRGGVQLFSRSTFTLVEGRGIPVVINAEALTSYPAIRHDLNRMSYAGYIAELMDMVISEGEADAGLYELMVLTMGLLAEKRPWLAARFFELRLLEHLGYQLHLEHCVHCTKPMGSYGKYAGTTGGLLCANCYGTEAGFLVSVSDETRALLLAFRNMPTDRMHTIYASARGQKELEAYLELQYCQILEYPLKTKAFLKELHLDQIYCNEYVSSN